MADQTFDDDVERALASLPPDFRAAVVLCDVEGLSYEEIAEVMDAKLGTVRSRIHRGRAMLRAALAHRAPTPGTGAVRRPRRDRAGPDGPRDVIGHLGTAGVGPPRRAAQRGRGREGLGARARLPCLPRPRRARGLGQDPARRALGPRQRRDPGPAQGRARARVVPRRPAVGDAPLPGRPRSGVAFLGGTALGAAVAGVLALGVAQGGALRSAARR